jgi:glutathione S-transferase
MKLYYAPGACSLACHIALERTGIAYDAQPVNLAKGEQRSPEYLAVHPRGVVPALVLDSGEALTESVAILCWLDRHFPDAKLTPKDTMAYGRMMRLLVWLSGTVHGQHFASVFRSARFATDETAHGAIAAHGLEQLKGDVAEIEAVLADRNWADDHAYTLADLYLIVLFRWARGKGLVDNAPRWTAYFEAATRDPIVRRILEKEGLIVSA